MLRFFCLFLAATFLVLCDPQTAWAATPKWPEFAFERAEGFYLNWIKIAASWVLFLSWVSTADWVNRDTQRHRFKYVRWNAIHFFPFFIAINLIWFIPIFWVSFPLALLSYLIPAFVYVRFRNGRVEEHARVMTGAHFRFLAAQLLNPLGFKIEAERRSEDEVHPIKVDAKGAADANANRTNLLAARQNPGFMPARDFLAEALGFRASTSMLDFTQQAVAVRHEVDGLWQNGEALDRESGDAILAVLKTISALNPQDRRGRQEGEFETLYENVKYKSMLKTQGTKTGERAVIYFDDGSARFEKLPDVGMREKLCQEVKGIIDGAPTLVLFSTPPRQGLTATLASALGSADRLVRSYIAVEEEGHTEPVVDNVPVSTYNPASGETPATVLPTLLRQYPDTIVCRNLVDAATVDLLSDQIELNRTVITTIRAKDSAEALLRVLMLKASPRKFAKAVGAVINQRLIRKLCDDCKEAYAPTPQLLTQLRLPQGKIEAFYRPPTPNEEQREEVCETCKGVGYLGRTGVFELLIVDDTVREVLIKSPKIDLLRKAARKAGMRSLQDEGVLMVARGVTSIQELSRVLKQ